MKLSIGLYLLVLVHAGTNTCDSQSFDCDSDHFCYSATSKSDGTKPMFFCSFKWVDFDSQKRMWGSDYEVEMHHIDKFSTQIWDQMGDQIRRE